MTIEPDSKIYSTVTENPIQFCMSVILKEAKKEDRLVKQIFYTMLSMYTNDPRNLAINSPTGEGKNYIIRKVADLFPKEDVIRLAGMSDKSLFHRSGTLVIKNESGEYESIEETLKKLDSAIEDKDNELCLTHDRNLKQALSSQIKDIEKEKKEIYKDAKKLIDLSHKTLIFLDTPRQELLSAIMSLLSHDEYEVEYEFVDTNNGIKTKTNILRGWPVVIFAQAIDYSHYKRYPEIQRRFIITNPRMDPEKYEAAIDLTFDRYCLPDFMYQSKIVSDLEKDEAREKIRELKQKILHVSTVVSPGKSNVFIPFEQSVKKSLTSKKASDMTIADRICGYLTLLASVNIENRPIIVLRKKGDPVAQTIPLATFEDLKETLFLMKYANGVRPYILDWYYDVFLPTYNAKTEVDFKIKGKIEIAENRIAVTSQQLVDATFKERKRKHSTRQIREVYLEQLINEGYVDSEKSELNRSADIYFPVVVTTTTEEVEKSAVFGSTPPESQTSKIIVEHSAIFPTKEYVISKIEALLKEAFQNGFLRGGENVGPNEMSDIKKLVEKYYKNPDEYFEQKEEENSSSKSNSENSTSQNAEITSESQEISQNNRNNSISELQECKTGDVSKKTALFSTSDSTKGFSCNYCYYHASNELEYNVHSANKHPNKAGFPDKNGRTS
jgi:hypothetical protein